MVPLYETKLDLMITPPQSAALGVLQLRGEAGRKSEWLSKFGQCDEWIFCLSAARMPPIRSEHDETDTAESQSGIQGEGGLAATKGDKTVAELAQQYDVQPNQITSWKAQLVNATFASCDGAPQLSRSSGT